MQNMFEILAEQTKGYSMGKFIDAWRAASLDVFIENYGPDGEYLWTAMKASRAGLIAVRRLKPTAQEAYIGWTYAFGENLPLYVGSVVKTERILRIWEDNTFTTINELWMFNFVAL